MTVFSLLSLLLSLLLTVPAFAATYTEGTLWYTIEDGAAIITGYFGDEESVWIPASIAGYLVSTIAAGAFIDTPAKTIYLPDTVTKVEEGAVPTTASLVYNANTHLPMAGANPNDTTPTEPPETAPTTPPTTPTNPTTPTSPTNPTTPTNPSGGGSNSPTQPTTKPTEATETTETTEATETTHIAEIAEAEELETDAVTQPETVPAVQDEASSPIWPWIVVLTACGLGLLGFWAWKKRSI